MAKLLGVFMEYDSYTVIGQFLSYQECLLLIKACEIRIFETAKVRLLGTGKFT